MHHAGHSLLKKIPNFVSTQRPVERPPQGALVSLVPAALTSALKPGTAHTQVVVRNWLDTK